MSRTAVARQNFTDIPPVRASNAAKCFSHLKMPTVPASDSEGMTTITDFLEWGKSNAHAVETNPARVPLFCAVYPISAVWVTDPDKSVSSIVPGAKGKIAVSRVAPNAVPVLAVANRSSVNTADEMALDDTIWEVFAEQLGLPTTNVCLASSASTEKEHDGRAPPCDPPPSENAPAETGTLLFERTNPKLDHSSENKETEKMTETQTSAPTTQDTASTNGTSPQLTPEQLQQAIEMLQQSGQLAQPQASTPETVDQTPAAPVEPQVEAAQVSAVAATDAQEDAPQSDGELEEIGWDSFEFSPEMGAPAEPEARTRFFKPADCEGKSVLFVAPRAASTEEKAEHRRRWEENNQHSDIDKPPTLYGYAQVFVFEVTDLTVPISEMWQAEITQSVIAQQILSSPFVIGTLNRKNEEFAPWQVHREASEVEQALCKWMAENCGVYAHPNGKTNQKLIWARKFKDRLDLSAYA